MWGNMCCQRLCCAVLYCVVRGCDKLSQLADSHKLGRTSCGQLARSEEGKYKYNNKIQWQIQNTAYSWSAAIRGSGLRAVVLFPLVEISLLHFPPLCPSGGRLHPSSHTIRLHTHTHCLTSAFQTLLCTDWLFSFLESFAFLFVIIVSSFSFFRVSMLPIMCDSRHSRSILMIQKCDFFNRWQIDSVLHRFLALFHASCQTRRDTAQRALLSHCQVQVHELAKTHTHTCTMTSMDCDAIWNISLYNVHNVNHNLKHHFLQWKL